VTIRSKLALGLFAIAIIMIAPLALALRSLENLHAISKRLKEREFSASMLLTRMRATADDIRQGEVALLFVHDSASATAMKASVARLRAMNDSLATYGVDAERRTIRQAMDSVDKYSKLEFAAAAPRPRDADSISAKHVLPAIRDAEFAMRSLGFTLADRTSAVVDRANTLADEARTGAVLGLLFASVVALIIAVRLWRSISRPVSDLEAGMAAVADGNFRYRLTVSAQRPDEFGRLAGSFQTMEQQLAQLDRLKAEFISVASHELKTPINVVLGYLQLIEEGLYGAIAPKLRETLRTIDAQTRALSRLVHQLLDVSRFEAGGGKLDLRAIDLGRFLDELEDTFRVLSMQRGIDFRIDRPAASLPEVMWDPDRMNEVLGNLLSNAFKFTGRGGMVELRVEANESAVSLTIRDTGAGIAPDQLPHIFKKFYQADNQASATQGGTGLGLAIANQIVHAHAGRISVESSVGEGTTFHIVMPVRPGARARPIPARPSVGAPA